MNVELLIETVVAVVAVVAAVVVVVDAIGFVRIGFVAMRNFVGYWVFAERVIDREWELTNLKSFLWCCFLWLLAGFVVVVVMMMIVEVSQLRVFLQLW